MDDEKKLTPENEFEDEFTQNEPNPNAGEQKPAEEFDEFNFTDDFPNEFSEEFMKKPNDTYEENPAQPEDEFTSPFAENEKTDEFSDDFTDTPSTEPQKSEQAAEPYSDFDTDFDDDFMTGTGTQNAKKADEFEEPYDPDADFADFFSKENKKTAGTENADNDLDLNLDSEAVLPPPPTERKGNIFKRHPWFTLIIFLFLLYGGYKFLQGTGTNEIQPVPSAQMTSAKQAVPVTAGVETRQISERLTTIEQGMNVLNDQLTQLQGSHVRIDQMEQMIAKIADEESTLQDTLTRLEALDQQITALNTLNQRLAALEAQVGVIADDVKIHITVSEQTQRAANLSRQAMQAKSMIPIPMVVQAAIPGRAWLLSESGELISVARGDDVPGYGRVMNIDPVAGTVTMSSETVFREKE
jgi:hypothetical protein